MWTLSAAGVIVDSSSGAKVVGATDAGNAVDVWARTISVEVRGHPNNSPLEIVRTSRFFRLLTMLDNRYQNCNREFVWVDGSQQHLCQLLPVLHSSQGHGQ